MEQRPLQPLHFGRLGWERSVPATCSPHGAVHRAGGWGRFGDSLGTVLGTVWGWFWGRFGDCYGTVAPGGAALSPWPPLSLRLRTERGDMAQFSWKERWHDGSNSPELSYRSVPASPGPSQLLHGQGGDKGTTTGTRRSIHKTPVAFSVAVTTSPVPDTRSKAELFTPSHQPWDCSD